MTQGKGRSDCPIGKNPGGRPRKHPMQKVINKETLMEIAKDRGFSTYKEFYGFLMEALGETRHAKVVRKMSYGTWTYTDICLLSDALELTPAEFVGVWFANLFHEVGGRVIAKIPEEDRQIYLNRELRTVSSGTRHGSFRNAKKTVEEIKDFLKGVD